MATIRHRTPDRPPDLAKRKAVERLLAELPEAGAIPRKGSELAFASPWELRALSIAVGLHREGGFAWQEFQQALVATIQEWEGTPSAEREEWSYYRHWVRALERLMVERGIAKRDEIDGKQAECVKATEETRHHQKAGLLAVDAVPAGDR